MRTCLPYDLLHVSIANRPHRCDPAAAEIGLPGQLAHVGRIG